MKLCTTCDRTKSTSEFPSKGNRCKQCAAEATKLWYAKKSQDETERRRIQKQRNDWHQNKLRTDEAYRAKHLARRSRNYAAKSTPETLKKEHDRAAARLLTVKGRAGFLVASARMRDKDCTLETSDILTTIEHGVCPRTGVKFDLNPHEQHHRNPYSPSLDRIDGSKGYTKDNVQVVCSWYNIAKNEYSDEQMLAFCRAVVDNAPKPDV